MLFRSINVRYLCGFTGSYGVLLVASDEAILFTDSRYTLAASAQCFDVEVRTCTNALQEAVVHSSHSLAVESEHISLAQYSHIASTTQVPLRESNGLVEQLRVIKDASEIARIREACHISTQALTKLVNTIRVGMSERHISRLLADYMLDAGADAPAFDSKIGRAHV